jgi:hypothetical protein
MLPEVLNATQCLIETVPNLPQSAGRKLLLTYLHLESLVVHARALLEHLKESEPANAVDVQDFEAFRAALERLTDRLADEEFGSLPAIPRLRLIANNSTRRVGVFLLDLLETPPESRFGARDAREFEMYEFQEKGRFRTSDWLVLISPDVIDGGSDEYRFFQGDSDPLVFASPAHLERVRAAMDALDAARATLRESLLARFTLSELL